MADEPKAAEAGATGEPDDTQKRPGGHRTYTWVWMVLALITVGGFLTWLGLASEPTAVTVVEDGTAPGEEPLPPGVTAVHKDSLADDKGAYTGQLIRVSNVAATGNLGPAIFWGELGDPTNQVPILVRLDSAAAEGFQPQVGGFYTVTGMVWAMSQELADAWYERGELAGEGEHLQASFADYYIQVNRIVPTPASMRDTETGTGGDGGAAG
jgi:hypothetical protein